MFPLRRSRHSSLLLSIAPIARSAAYRASSGVETGLQSFVDLTFQVVPHLFVEFLLHARAADDGTKSDAKPCEPARHLVTSSGPRPARTMPEMAADRRSQLAASSATALRPARVSE